MIKNLFLGAAYLFLGGILGQMIAGMIGCLLAVFRCMIKGRWKRVGLAIVIGLIVFYVGVPLTLLAAGTLGDNFGYKMQSVIPIGAVIGFLVGWFWMAFGWMSGSKEN
jgi:hypothetical protein